MKYLVVYLMLFDTGDEEENYYIANNDISMISTIVVLLVYFLRCFFRS